ncbi:MAG: hypothetical protein D6720_08395, partial [Gammaproteobacteria bacterium]
EPFSDLIQVRTLAFENFRSRVIDQADRRRRGACFDRTLDGPGWGAGRVRAFRKKAHERDPVWLFAEPV